MTTILLRHHEVNKSHRGNGLRILLACGSLLRHGGMTCESSEQDGCLRYEMSESTFVNMEHTRHHCCTSQEYIVYAYGKTDWERVLYCRRNQDKLRADLYNGLCDAVRVDDGVTGRSVGKPVILPASFMAVHDPCERNIRYCMKEKHQAPYSAVMSVFIRLSQILMHIMRYIAFMQLYISILFSDHGVSTGRHGSGQSCRKVIFVHHSPHNLCTVQAYELIEIHPWLGPSFLITRSACDQSCCC